MLAPEDAFASAEEAPAAVDALQGDFTLPLLLPAHDAPAPPPRGQTSLPCGYLRIMTGSIPTRR